MLTKKKIKDIEIEQINLGAGRKILLQNIWITQINVEEIKIKISSNFQELDKQNNEVVLEVK
jgi:hypothetical protein